MTPERYSEIQSAFLRIRDLDGPDRAEPLSRLDAETRREVELLLACDQDCGGFLETTENEGTAALPSGGSSAERLPQPTATAGLNSSESDTQRQVGPYRLLQQIGEGGFGTVYMAEQKGPIVRKVAVKLVKPGMDSKQVLARFDAERQALAMMDHSSIAKVLDAGCSPDGTPYFVMELVRGIPIHDFCEQQQLDLQDRLNLMMQVCSAVHHAHQKGVIHRDLKPSNILVAMGEGEPTAKVIDFGIAKALDTRLTEQTLFTEYGQMMGTLEYMSPEQAEMSAVDIDTRSDVYSLGVVLYQLLTGETPIGKEELLRNGVFEIPRLIRETEHATPSTRVTARQGQLPGVSRTTEPRGLRNLKRGDLDWITMKALAKDRRRRYDSARDLALDVGRYLDGQPVEAHPPSITYRAIKHLRRHRVAVLTATAVLVGALVGVLGLVAGIREVNEARRQAELDRDAAFQAENNAAQASQRLTETMYPQMVQSAWKAYREGRREQSRRLLDSCPSPLRGWEWRFIRQSLDTQTHRFLRESQLPAATSVATSPTTRLIACVIEDGSVEIRSRDHDENRHTIRGDINANTAQFSPDGSQLYVGTIEGELRIYQCSDWRLTHSRSLGLGGVYEIAFDSPAMTYAVCSGGAFVAEYQAATHRLMAKWKLPARLSTLVFDSQNATWLGAGLDGNLYRMDRSTVDQFHHWSVSSASLLDMQWLDSDRVAVLASGTVYGINVRDDSSNVTELASGSRLASAFALSQPDIIAIGNGDGSVDAYRTDAPAEKIASFGSSVQSMRWLDDEQNLLLTLGDGRIALTGSEPSDSQRLFPSASVLAGVVLPEHSMTVVLEAGGSLRNLDLQSGETITEVLAHNDAPWALATDQRQTILATVGEDMRLCCWKLPSLEKTFEARLGLGVRDVCVAPDGTWIAAAPPVEEAPGQREGSIGIWDPETGKCDRVLNGHGNWVVRLDVSENGALLASASVDRSSRLWSVGDWKTKHVLSPAKQSTAEHFAFHPSVNRLFVGHRDGWVTSWDIDTGAAGPTWPAFGDSLSGLIADGDRLLASSRSDSRLKVHDVRLNRTVAELDLGMGHVVNMQESPNGHVFSFLDENGRALIRRVDP